MELDPIRDWARLPAHLLDSVVERLELLSDYLQFSAVCKPWYCVAMESKTQQAKLELYSGRPMLLISANVEDTWNVYNVIDNKVLNLQLNFSNKRFVGCSRGWLLTMEENYAVTLINPFFRIKGRRNQENSIIRLPQLNPPEGEYFATKWAKDCGTYVVKAAISADPILEADKCIVMVIATNPPNMFSTAFLKLCQDTSWTYIESKRYIVDVIFSNDKEFGPTFFFTNIKGHLFGTDAQSGNTFAPIYIWEHDDYEEVKMVQRYLVDSNSKEDLLLIERGFKYEAGIRTTTEFKVFEFNRQEESRWDEKKTLGDDIAIFVGDNSAISVVASKFSGCEPNCIYFVRDYDRRKLNLDGHGHEDYGMYNFQNNSFSRGPNSTDLEKLMKNSKLCPVWAEPSVQLF